MQPAGNQTFFRGGNRILGGVCSGLAEGFHVEVLWVRLAFVVLTFLNGIGALLYVILWVLIPERTGYRPAGQGAFDSMSADIKRAWADLRTQFRGSGTTTPSTASASANDTPSPVAPPEATGSGQPALVTPSAPAQSPTGNPTFIFGAILIVVGIAFLAANTNFITWSVIWPLVLVVLGIALLVRNMERKS